MKSSAINSLRLLILLCLIVFTAEKAFCLTAGSPPVSDDESIAIRSFEDYKDFIAKIEKFKHIRSLRIFVDEVKTIDPVLFKLENLEQLYIVNYEMDYLPDLSPLKKLNTLAIPNVKKAPTTLANLKSLEHLYIYDAKMKFLPEYVLSLSNLKTLSITTNALYTPATVMGIKSIKGISRLSNLEYLCIAHCPGLLKIDPEIGKLKKLKYLDVSSIPAVKIPDFVGELSELETFISFPMTISAKTKVILPASFAKLKNLKKLDVYNGNEIPGLESFVNLEELHCSVGPGIDLSKLTKMKWLSVTLKKDTEIPTWFIYMENLEKLAFWSSGIKKSTIPEEIGNLKNLVTINLDDAGLETLPESMVKLKKLELLSIKRNALKSVPKVLMEMGNLKTVELTKNPIPVAEIEELKKAQPKLKVRF